MRNKFIAAIVIIALSVCAVISGLPASAATVNPDSPALGQNDPSTDFNTEIWMGAANVGSKRHDVHRKELVLVNGWGQRGTFNTAFDITDFSVTLDVSNIPVNCTVMLMFGNAPGAYPTAGVGMMIEVLSSPVVAGAYHVVIGSGAQHNVSYPEFEQVSDSTYIGKPVDPADNKIDVSFLKVGSVMQITVEGDTYSVPYTRVSDALTAESCYLAVGALNSASPDSVIFENMMDKNMKAYYAANGVFDTVSAQISAYVNAANGDLSEIQLVDAAKALGQAVQKSSLKYGDSHWFAARLAAADAKVSAAYAALGDETIAALESDIIAFENSVTGLAAELTAIDNAIGKKAEADSTIAFLETLPNLSQGGLDTIADYKARVESAGEILLAAIDTLVTAQIDDFYDAASDLTSAVKFAEAKALRSQISNSLKNRLSEERKAALDAIILSADNLLASVNDGILEGWTLNERAYAFEGQDSFDFYTDSGRVKSTIAYGESKIDASNFELKLNFSKLDKQSSGGWFSFGIMEKPESFILADDAAVQGNKGLFFLMIPETNKLRVEVYLITVTSGRFFDGIRTEILSVSYTESQDLSVRISPYSKTLAGVTTTYLKIAVGNTVMATDLITLGQLKTALGIDENGDLKPAAESTLGYLVLCGESSTGNWMGTVKSINNQSPLSALSANAGKTEIEKVADSIAALPEAAALTLENKDGVKASIAAVKAAYNALSDDEKANVTNYGKIAELETKIAQLEEPAKEEPKGCGKGGAAAALLLPLAALMVVKKRGI